MDTDATDTDATDTDATGKGAPPSPAAARDAAHRPGSALAGPYGHPVHPLLVTVPIGAFVCTLAFDVASKLVEGRSFGRAGLWLSAIGIVSGVVAAAFGFLDARRIVPGTPAHRVATLHMVLMDSVLILFVIGFFVRRADEDQYLDGTPVLALVLSAVGVAVMLVGGWLGGRLVYTYGLRVADDADQLAGFDADQGPGASVPPDVGADS